MTETTAQQIFIEGNQCFSYRLLAYKLEAANKDSRMNKNFCNVDVHTDIP